MKTKKTHRLVVSDDSPRLLPKRKRLRPAWLLRTAAPVRRDLAAVRTADVARKTAFTSFIVDRLAAASRRSSVSSSFFLSFFLFFSARCARARALFCPCLSGDAPPVLHPSPFRAPA